MPEATESCKNCNKLQTELPKSLKHCARCGTENYCSRECQAADFKRHKKTCRPPKAGVSGSLSNPPQDDIIESAQENVTLLIALFNSPELVKPNHTLTTVPILRYLYDFVQKTHDEYFSPILQPKLGVEMTSRLPTKDSSTREDAMADMQKMHDDPKVAFDMNEWPKFNKEKYVDALGRMFMARMVVADFTRQAIMGQPPGQVYRWSEEVDRVVREQMGAEDFDRMRSGGRQGG